VAIQSWKERKKEGKKESENKENLLPDFFQNPPKICRVSLVFHIGSKVSLI
jgi:hypothetical protein